MHRLRKGSSFLQNFSVPQFRRKALNSLSAVQDTYYSTKDTFERHKVVFTIATSVGSVVTAWAGYTLRHLHEKKVERRLDSIETAMRNNYHLEHAEFKKLVGSSSSGAAYAATAGASLIIGHNSESCSAKDAPKFLIQKITSFDSSIWNISSRHQKAEYIVIGPVEEKEFTPIIFHPKLYWRGRGGEKVPLILLSCNMRRYGMGWRGGKWYANRKFRKEQMKLLEKIKPRRAALNYLGKRLRRWKKSETAIKASEAPQKDIPITPISAEANHAC